MNFADAVRLSYEMERMVSMGYLQDLTDAELLHRPAPGANHINWQLGHLISAEHHFMEKIAPGSMPALPDGFTARYAKETAIKDDPAAFESKAVLLATAAAVREGTLRNLQNVKDADLSRETGIHYAPTVATVFMLQGSHWLMHAGQWAVTRRQLGRPPLF